MFSVTIVVTSERPPGLVSVFVKVVREEKPSALWKGLVPVSNIESKG